MEEDLVELFGLAKIDEALDRSFRTLVNQQTDVTPLGASIGLITGPGPTVNRALTEPHYFSTVVQCEYLDLKSVLLLYNHNSKEDTSPACASGQCFTSPESY